VRQELTGENGAPLMTGIQVSFVKPNEWNSTSPC
jgi:hypothetical protein